MTCSFLVSWIESIALLVVPRHIYLFSLVTIKLFIQSLKRLLFSFWWLIGLYIGIDYLFNRIYPIGSQWANFSIIIGWIALVMVWFFVVYLTVRPSIKLKSYNYYWPYWYFYIVFVAFVLITYVGVACIGFGIERLLLKSTIELNKAAGIYRFSEQVLVPLFTLFMPSAFIPFFLSPLASFYMFFVLDSDGRLRSVFASLWRALKMVFLNYPFCLITFIIFKIVHNWTDALEGSTGLPFITVLMFIGVPLVQCIYAQLYTKRLHDQFQCYFPAARKE